MGRFCARLVSFLFMAMQYGIAIRNVCVRTEPTMEPLRKREGDVWDRRQESRLLIGEPVCLKRLAGGWCYVISDSTEGYAKEDGIFICTKRHYEKYRELVKREFQVVIKPGRYRDGQYFRVGTVLPLFDEEQKLDICRKQGPEAAPCRLREGTGRGCAPVLIRSYLPFTERQIRLQAERMLGIPYSWGDERLDGMDCASTVRGLYACFGFVLPRNSGEQRNFGEQLGKRGQAVYRDLTGVSGEEKREIIAELGSGALLHMPGHVMLYMGESKGEPRIFHNCDTYMKDGEEHIVRKTVISPFYPKGDGTYLDYLTAAWKPVLDK